jgi:hypothetical protein
MATFLQHAPVKQNVEIIVPVVFDSLLTLSTYVITIHTGAIESQGNYSSLSVLLQRKYVVHEAVEHVYPRCRNGCPWLIMCATYRIISMLQFET